MRIKHLITIVTCLLLPALHRLDAQVRHPVSVRDYFMLLPQQYFAIESCNTDVEKDCRPLKRAYVQDNLNGYLQGDGDGAQEKFKMVVFKSPNGRTIIGLNVFGEFGERYNFLEYKDHRWRDVSKAVIPNYKRSNIYELPRYGNTIKVL